MSFDPEAHMGPFHELLGIEITRAAGGEAAVTLPLRTDHSSRHETVVAQGGVVFTLADFCGGLALLSRDELTTTPTIDMRIDYLRPATTDLRAEGEVLRAGGQTGVAHVDVFDDAETKVATARGVYKTSALGADAPWTPGE